MYANGGGLGIATLKKWREKKWRPVDRDDPSRINGKRFVGCVCPKCDGRHSVYMRWTGRGVPRKYCANCKPLISTYDDMAVYEASVSAPEHSKKKGRRHDCD